MNIETAVGPLSAARHIPGSRVLVFAGHFRLEWCGWGGRGCRTRDVWVGRGADLLLTSQYTFGVRPTHQTDSDM